MVTEAVTRTAAVWVPDWPVVAAMRVGDLAPHLPVAVMNHRGVLAASAAARAAGVRRGMRKRTAQGVCPSLVLVPADENRDAAEFEAVAVAAEEVVAGLEVVRPGLALLAADGAARYYGSEEGLAAELVEAVSLAGFECQVGIADGILAAVLAARTSEIVPAGCSVAFLRDKPVADLEAAHPPDNRLLADAVSLWNRLGLRTLGALTDLPLAAVAERFGEIGMWARQLACGADLRPPAGRRIEEDVSVAMHLDPPILRLEGAVLAGQQVAENFAALMSDRSLSCGRIRITATTSNGSRSRVWRTDDGAIGGMGAAKISQRVRWQLDGWLTSHAVTGAKQTREFVSDAAHLDEFAAGELDGPAPILALEITAEEVTAASSFQTSFWGGESGADQRARRALEHVQGLLGADQVQAVVLQGGRTPGSRERRFTFGEPEPEIRSLAQPWPGALPDPAPTVLCDSTPAQLLSTNAEGSRIEGSRIDLATQSLAPPPRVLRIGETSHEVLDWAGPWVIPGNWWDGKPESATYLQVVTTGGAFLLRDDADGFVLVGEYQ
ncbi:MAG: DNA polymerase Y family protein [Promicromonosporaceae bacterium]|nr:DNA polymerase Y family protein [Promicromonosporaceae bacterium]